MKPGYGFTSSRCWSVSSASKCSAVIEPVACFWARFRSPVIRIASFSLRTLLYHGVADMDPLLELETRRLVASTALTAHALRSLGGRLAADGNAAALLEAALRLGEEADLLERRYRLRFEPPYPGVTAGVEGMEGGPRLVLACTAGDPEGNPLGVVFTTLIPGRRPQVSVAPVEARIPEEWRPLADLF